MKKKTIFITAALSLLLSLVIALKVYNNPEQVLISQNVEALSESDLSEKCGGCSTEKTHYCCWAYFEDLGTGYFLFKD